MAHSVSNHMKIRPVGVQLFHAGGRTDRHEEAKVAFRNFANANENTIPVFEPLKDGTRLC